MSRERIEREVIPLESNVFTLNDIFGQNAKVYQTRPVRAMKYQEGMENGWMIYMSNKPFKSNDIPVYAGIKFFDTKEDVMRYVEANEPQYAMYKGELLECEVEYDLLRPVMYRKYTDGEERLGVDMGIKGFTFVSDESEIYDFYILEDSTWIILDADGNIRVWEQDFLDCASTTFFGEPEDFVYERCMESGKEEYIKAAV